MATSTTPHTYTADRSKNSTTCMDVSRELVATVRKNVTIDWTLRENVRAQLRVLVKRILHKHGYPPDKQEKAQTVLEQAALPSDAWAAAA
jgi:type I restriction enzyme, R subunit